MEGPSISIAQPSAYKGTCVSKIRPLGATYGGAVYIVSISSLRVVQGSSVSFFCCTAGWKYDNNGGGVSSNGSNITVGANARVSFENNSVLVDVDGIRL